MPFEDSKIQVIKERYTTLLNQYEALNEQYDESLDAGQKAILKDKIQKLDAEIEVLGKYIEKSATPPLLDKIHYIDFKSITKQFEALLDTFGRTGGASVLIVQNSAVMAGDLLMMRLQEDLKRKASDFKPYHIGFSADNELNEFGFLKRLSNYLGITSNLNHIDELLGQVIERLCESLQTRSIVFLQISHWHSLPAQEQVFSWLCDTFYPKLVSCLSETVRQKSFRRIYVFLVIVSEDFFPDECLENIGPFMGTATDIQVAENKRIFEVALENWSKDDIEDWLEFAGLPDDQLESTASRLYRRSQSGLPLIIRDAIEREFCNIE